MEDEILEDFAGLCSGWTLERNVRASRSNNNVPMETEPITQAVTWDPSMKIMDQAMSNLVVMGTVIQYLGVRDLLNARQLSRGWSELTTSALVKRRLFINRDVLGSEEDTEQLISCIQSSSNFPFRGLETASRSFLKPEAQELFQVFGQKIKYLVIDSEFQSKEELRALLFESVPNVEHLYIQRIGTPLLAPEEPYFPEGTFLPQLKVLQFKNQCCWPSAINPVVKGILEAAVNLERIEDFQFEFWDAIPKNKVHLVKSCRVWKQNGHFVTFSSLQPALRSFNVKLIPRTPTMESGLIQVFESSKDSLKELCTQQMLPFQYPIFSQLKFLQVEDGSVYYEVLPTDESLRENLRIFPKDFNFNQTFPQVKTLKFRVKSWSEARVKLFFPEDDFEAGTAVVPFSGIKKLILPTSFDKFGLVAIKKKFPELEDLELTCFDFYDHPTERYLWTFKNLTSLTLTGISFGQWPVLCLDSLFTGIDQDYLPALRFYQDVKKGFEFRREPFLPMMENLTLLKVVVKQLTDHPMPESAPGQFISWISNVYAFQLMPKLQVYFAYDHHLSRAADTRQALKPIADFVTFLHQDEDPLKG